jgi:hypothetical protein
MNDRAERRVDVCRLAPVDYLTQVGEPGYEALYGWQLSRVGCN